MMNEEPKRKRGRPKKNKNVKTTDENSGEHKKNGTGTPPKSKSDGNKKRKKDKRKTTNTDKKNDDTRRKKRKKVKDEEKQPEQVEGRVTKFKVDEEENREELNKDTNKNRKSGKSAKRTNLIDLNIRLRVRTKKEHDEAIRYLTKKLYTSINDKDKDKYNYMIDKLNKYTRII